MKRVVQDFSLLKTIISIENVTLYWMLLRGKIITKQIGIKLWVMDFYDFKILSTKTVRSYDNPCS